MYMDMSRWCYFIKNQKDGLIKIGYSNDPSRRLVELQRKADGELSLISYALGGDGLEHVLHKIFKPFRVRHEWFLPVKGLRILAYDDMPRLDTPPDDLSNNMKRLLNWLYINSVINNFSISEFNIMDGGFACAALGLERKGLILFEGKNPYHRVLLTPTGGKVAKETYEYFVK